jgi:hypothetical protein
MNVSLDGYIADEDGKTDWTAPDEEFFSFINDLERPVGTYRAYVQRRTSQGLSKLDILRCLIGGLSRSRLEDRAVASR